MDNTHIDQETKKRLNNAGLLMRLRNIGNSASGIKGVGRILLQMEITEEAEMGEMLPGQEFVKGCLYKAIESMSCNIYDEMFAIAQTHDLDESDIFSEG